VIIGSKHQNEKFFSSIKAMRQKEIKAPIIYITVHIPKSIQRNRSGLNPKTSYLVATKA
jgi:hypothetical protein